MDYAKQYQQNKGADEECSKKTVVSNVELKADDTDTSDSGSEVEFGDSNNLKGKRLKKIQPKSHIQKKLRGSGKKYLNYRNQEIPEKRVLANPCNENCVNACNTFTELERNQIFTLFWSLGSNIEKRSFINGCVNIVPVKRKRTTAKDSRRNLTYQYFLMKGDAQKRVCLQFFLNTLNVTQKLVRNSLQGKIKENVDKRGIHAPKHKASPDQINAFKQFIDSLPAVPSHYCRGSSTKLYLPSEIRGITNLFRM
nr:unnamed protein product [Callosobruchus analis]